MNPPALSFVRVEGCFRARISDGSRVAFTSVAIIAILLALEWAGTRRRLDCRWFRIVFSLAYFPWNEYRRINSDGMSSMITSIDLFSSSLPFAFLDVVEKAWVRALGMVPIGAAVACFALWLFIQLGRAVCPKVTAVAMTSVRESTSQPLFYIILAIGVFALLIYPFLSYNTFGDDIKMLKAEGLTFIKILGIFLAVWTASVSISEEIEGRTALTLLSKPISRRSLLIGKFFGVIIPVIILFIVLGSLFLCTVSYKLAYDARETSQTPPDVVACQQELDGITPGLVLVFMESVILAAISVAVSTRLPMIPNLIICISIYALGHLIPLIVQSSSGRMEIVQFIAWLLSSILPVLENFTLETKIATGRALPHLYLVWSGLYCLAYSGMALLVGLLLFEDRDVA